MNRLLKFLLNGASFSEHYLYLLWLLGIFNLLLPWFFTFVSSCRLIGGILYYVLLAAKRTKSSANEWNNTNLFVIISNECSLFYLKGTAQTKSVVTPFCSRIFARENILRLGVTCRQLSLDSRGMRKFGHAYGASENLHLFSAPLCSCCLWFWQRCSFWK